MILAEKIMEERKKNGWSQEELAEKLSVSRQAVSKWESAQSIPDLQRVAVPSYLVCIACTALFFDLCRSGIEWNTSLLFACTLCRIDFVCGGIHSVVTPVEKGFDASSICTVM